MQNKQSLTESLENKLRAWTRGDYPLEAGLELLIRTGDAIHADAPWLLPSGQLVSVDVDRLLTESTTWPSTERSLVAIAASLLSPDHPVDLGDAVSALDRHGAALALAAIAHANGSHELHNEVELDELGRSRVVGPCASLFPWPAEPQSTTHH